MAGDLKLQYVGSLTNDNLAYTAYKDHKAVGNSKTLAVLRKGGTLKSIYIHCNSNILVTRDTTNVSKHYAVRRKWRNWAASLDSTNPDTLTSGYTSDTSAAAIDSGEKPVGEWHDGPGAKLLYRQTKYERLLAEWVIGADTSYDHTLVQGLGGLYFFVVFDLTPAAYRFAMSPSYDLTASQVQDVLDTSDQLGPLPADGPWKTEADVADADWVARQTVWQDYAALNAELPLQAP